jgi:predicted Rossmann fold flavoprotein
MTVDLCPADPEQAVEANLQRQALAEGKKQLAAILPQQIPHRLGQTLLVLSGLAPDRKAAGLTRDERRRLAANIKGLHVPITGTLGFKKAEVTAGGIALDEIDSRTMQSKLVPGLYLAGEVLDLDGPIGGYNFQAAWSTGWLAGSSV